jgi:hypothetical protein
MRINAFRIDLIVGRYTESLGRRRTHSWEITPLMGLRIKKDG